MNEPFSLIPKDAAQQLAVAEIIRCNLTTSRYGLTLKESEAQELANTRSEVLQNVGRIEFAGGVLNKLILAFCDSPYLNQSSYAEILHELVETFYYFKNEALDELDDDDLISFMKKSFDSTCRGSVELLQTRGLEILSRKVRYGVNVIENLNEESQKVFEEDCGEEEMDEMVEYEDNSFESYADLYRYYRKEL